VCFQCWRERHGACNVRITMDDNSNPRSAHLGVFVVMGVVPIVGYMLVWFVLPWVERGFH
jgi:hypothetical protein